jgi:hypothetical protein
MAQRTTGPKKRTDTFALPDGEEAELYLARKIPEHRREPIEDLGAEYRAQSPEQDVPTFEVQGELPDLDDPNLVGPQRAHVEFLYKAKAEAEEAQKKAPPRKTTVEGFKLGRQLANATILGYVKSWSLDLPLTELDEDGEEVPCFKSLRELDAETYDALKDECMDRYKKSYEKKDKDAEASVGADGSSSGQMDPTEP